MFKRRQLLNSPTSPPESSLQQFFPTATPYYVLQNDMPLLVNQSDFEISNVSFSKRNFPTAESSQPLFSDQVDTTLYLFILDVIWNALKQRYPGYKRWKECEMLRQRSPTVWCEEIAQRINKYREKCRTFIDRLVDILLQNVGDNEWNSLTMKENFNGHVLHLSLMILYGSDKYETFLFFLAHVTEMFIFVIIIDKHFPKSSVISSLVQIVRPLMKWKTLDDIFLFTLWVNFTGYKAYEVS